MAAEKLILFFAVIFLFQKNAYGFNGNRIVNGSATPDEVFEFVTRLAMIVQGYGTYHSIEKGQCTSTIISKRHILTAAHCIVPTKPIHENNSTSIFTSKWVRRIQGIAVEFRRKGKGMAGGWEHKSLQTRTYFLPSYEPYRSFGDIAIIEFPEGTNLNITPITLASDYVEKEGDMGIAAGYGVYKVIINEIDGTEIRESPNILQNVTLPIHPSIDCIPPSFLLCTISHESYTYFGDSGGPLMIERNEKFYQIGITSFGRRVNETSFESYTRISVYCNWIYNVTKGEVDCEKLPEE
uniref:Peptidase S1 domain-containing protein n=1 Tax=Panagrolaimus davidi TaxID=227884 RepID=A0A914PHK9_9BILA